MTEQILVYVAEPIDAVDRNHPTHWLGAKLGLRESLRMAGFNMFDPAGGFDAPHPDPRVEQINRAALYAADCLVAHLPPGVPSIGVPSEIEAATNRGIPAVVLYGGQSQTLAGNPLVTVIDHVSSVAEAVRRAINERPLVDPAAAPPVRLVIRDGFELPGRAYADDAGVDLAISVGGNLDTGQYAIFQTQVDGSQLPDGYWGLIVGRSSAMNKRRLLVNIGVIDAGWRGPLLVGVLNTGPRPVAINPGERLAQLILIPNTPAPVVAVDKVDDHPRGLNGFGSSGG